MATKTRNIKVTIALASPNFPLPHPLKPHKIGWLLVDSVLTPTFAQPVIAVCKRVRYSRSQFYFHPVVGHLFSFRVTVLSPRKAFLVVSAEQLPTVRLVCSTSQSSFLLYVLCALPLRAASYCMSYVLCPSDQGLLWSPLDSSILWQPPPRHHCCLSFHVSRLLSFSEKARHTPACGLHVCCFLSNSYCLFSIIGICLQMLPWSEISKTTYFSHIAPFCQFTMIILKIFIIFFTYLFWKIFMVFNKCFLLYTNTILGTRDNCSSCILCSWVMSCN